MSKAILLTPVIAAAYPVVFLYANNADQVSAATVVAPLLIALAGSASLTLLLWSVFRDDVRPSVIATVWVLLFFFYNQIFNTLPWISAWDTSGVTPTWPSAH